MTPSPRLTTFTPDAGIERTPEMDAQLRAQLNQTIYVANPSSANSFGELSYTAPEAVKARVEFRTDIESGGNGGAISVGEGEVAGTTVLVITESRIRPMSRVWLPGVDSGDVTLARRPQSVVELPGENGETDHYETRV